MLTNLVAINLRAAEFVTDRSDKAVASAVDCA